MRAVTAVFGGIALAVAVAASADEQGSPRTLKGNYALSGSASCVFAAAFTSNFAPIGHASANAFSRHGVLTFNEDGTGTSATRVVAIGDPDPGDSGATSAIDSSGSFTYSVTDDGTLILAEGTITSSFVAGPRAGIQTQTTDVATLVGHVSRDKRTLVFGSFDPAVETTIRLDLGLVDSRRICQRANTAVRIDGDQ